MLQETPKPLSTSQLEGSTSELEGSTLASSPRTTQQTEFPTITGEELQALDDGNLPQVRKRIRQREAIENVLRNNIAANPDLINTPGASEELQKRVLNLTGDNVLSEQITKSLMNISRERRILDSESQGSLDVTPEFNQGQIMQQIRLANKQSNKDALLASGKTEEEAELESNILFPEQEIGKSIDLGINIDKVKNDYVNYLKNNEQDKFSDLISELLAKNWGEKKQMSFMQNALSHQNEIVDAKISGILAKGKDNISENDLAEIERLEGQKDRLSERFKNLINDFPEVREEMLKEKASQKAVDESYKRAKANALLPGWEGNKARAEVLYQQVVAPVGASAVDMVGNIIQTGLRLRAGTSANQVEKGFANAIADWANGFFDTEKSSSIYKKPSELKGALFENGEFQSEKLVPKISETLFQMYALLGGGNVAGKGLEGIGVGTNIAQKTGLVANSFLTTQSDYYDEAKAQGLSNDEAMNFANASGLLTSTLELINPQTSIFGTSGKKAFTKKVIDAINDGVDMKKAIKQNVPFVFKEIVGENLQEFSQTAGDLGMKYLFNKKNEDDIFDVSLTQDEILETVLLTSIVSGAGSVHGVKSRNSLETESLYRASQDVDKFKEFLNKPETQEQYSEEQLNQVSEKVDEYKKVVDGLPNNLDENSKVKLASLVYAKKQLNESKKEVFTDDVVASKAGDNIQTQIDELNGQISMVFDEQTDTNIDKPLENVNFSLEEGGDVEYKIGDQFFSEQEMVDKLNDEEFTKSVREGEVNMTVSNPSEGVSLALQNSGLLTNDQLQTIKPEQNVEETQTEEGEQISQIEPVAEQVQEPAPAQAEVTTPQETEIETEIPQEKVDQLTELNFTEEAISQLSEEQVDNIIADNIEFTEDLDLETAGFPAQPATKIQEGFDELTNTIPEEGAPANVFNPPAAFNALKKITEGVVEETGLQGAKLINELKARMEEQLGENYNESDLDDVSAEITEFAKTIEKVETQEEKQAEAPKTEKEDIKDTKKQKAKKVSQPKKEGKKVKQSGFQERTLETAEGSPAKEQVRRVVEENRQFYEVMNIQETVEVAAREIEKQGGFDKAYESLVSETATIDELPTLQAKRQLALDFYGEQLDLAVKNGRKGDMEKAYKRTKNLQDAISRDATKAGQANSMLQIWKALRPDGTVEFMDRKINEYNEKKLKEKPRNSDKTIGEQINNFQEFVDNITEEQIDEILKSDLGKSAISKIIAKQSPRLQNELKEKIRRRKAKVDSVVNRLDSLKISGDKLFALPPGINMLPTVWNGSIEVLKKTVQAGESMATAIDKAVDYIKSKVGEEDFGEKAYRDLFKEEKKSLDTDEDIAKEIDQTLKDLELSINDIIKKHYTEKESLARDLVEKLTEDAGLTPEEATELSKAIQREFNKKVKDKAAKRLAKDLGMSRIPVSREAKKLADDLLEKINLGALDSDFYNSLFAEKFGLAKPLTVEQRAELKRLADIVSKQEPGSLFERQAIMDMLKFMDAVYPKKNVFNTFFSLYYASLLSGMTTSVLNIVSAGSNIIGRPIREVTNMSKWYRAAKKGIKNKSVKDFLAYAPFNDFFYMPTGFTHAASLGTKEFSEVWKNGDLDSKFIEQVANKEFSKLSPLERERYGKNAFKPINLKVGGKKISLNPFNYYKYVGRNLAAQDKLMFRFSHDIELLSIIREQQLENGLRGEKLRKAVIDEYTQRKVDMDAVNEKLDKEITEMEKDTGKKVTKTQRKIRLREILESNLDQQMKKTAEDIGRSNIFTDSRGGMIANTAAWIGKMSNSNPGLAFALKPWVPFTRVVGNVSEYMMDTIPLYGQLRANGLGVTGLAKWAGVKDLNTSQMGVPESREYYEQMGRAWLGTTAFLMASMLLVGTDEEDDIYITGGYAPDKFKRGRENVTPKYTLVVNGVEIPYLNIPGLAIPLALIGNYNDRLNMGDSDENTTDRLLYSTFNGVTLMKDMSFLKGIQDLLEMVSDLTSGEVSAASRGGKELYKKYFLTATKPLPQNFNLIDQIEKVFDPTSYSQKDIIDMTMYGLGIQRWMNKPSLDTFGEEITTLPGESLMPYAHWLGLKGDDDRWKFLSKYNAIPNKVNGYDEIMFINDDFSVEQRTPEKEELFDYTKRAGEIFSNNLQDYMSQGGFDEREKIMTKRGDKEVTLIQKQVGDLWSMSKRQARAELFTK